MYSILRTEQHIRSAKNKKYKPLAFCPSVFLLPVFGLSLPFMDYIYKSHLPCLRYSNQAEGNFGIV